MKRFLALTVLFASSTASACAAQPEAGATSEAWWSLKPIQRPAVPAIPGGMVRNPIDAFVLTELAAKRLTPTVEADRRTLLRRLSYDLIGLPPTPDEMRAFLEDPRPDAYERQVDRLLASPHYGERWARHWLDVAHFAETHGHDQDRVRPNAWPYRDYLIAAFNGDKPYSRFVTEQIAADVLHADQPALAPALGFAASGPWDESSLRDIREDSIDRQIGHYLDRDDMVTTVMGTFTSVTIHCARCHDHKFDPISQEDYYSLQAVFAGVGRADRVFDLDTKTADERRRRQMQLAATEKVLPLLHYLNWGILGQFAKQRATASLGQLPPAHKVYAVAKDFTPDGTHKPLPRPRDVFMLKRGDIHKPGKLASPGALSCLSDLPARFSPASADDEASRRAALARWIIDPKNPLTWRSIVNRVWHYHFGRGLVDTPNDFGRMGAVPTHPELLDWLAADFRDGGQSLKRLHRLIVTSGTYRQASAHNPANAKVDADNRFLWRMNRSRLDAESVRDSILMISGRLDRRAGGPSDQQFATKPGIHVTPIVEYGPFAWDRPTGHRRSVYRFIFRTLPDPFVDCLDGADSSQWTPARNVSITAPQALALLNNDFVLVHAAAMARDLEQGFPAVDERIATACRRAWSRSPTREEALEMKRHVEQHGLASLCRLLLNSNEFLFVN